MAKSSINRSGYSKFTRIIVKLLLFLLAFVVLVFLLLLTPPAQRYLTGRVENFLEKKLQTRVEIKRIAFDPFGNVKLKEVYVEDRKKDTLLNGTLIKARLNYFKLFSDELRIKELTLSGITAHLSRGATDSFFNFQFIVDAFAGTPDPTDSIPSSFSAGLDRIILDDVKIAYKDAVAGSDMYVDATTLVTGLHSPDLNGHEFSVPGVVGKDIIVRIKQVKPLASPEPVSKDIAEAMQPIPLQLDMGSINLENISFNYDNDVSDVYASADLGTVQIEPNSIDLPNRQIDVEALRIANSIIRMRAGKKEQAEQVIEELEKELMVQETTGWNLRAGNIRLDNNQVKFDNDNRPTGGAGINYAHLDVKDLTLYADGLVLNRDSIGATISRAYINEEQSGFVLEQLEGDLLYATNEAYARNLLIKTPATEIKRNARIQFASRDELVAHFDRTLMEADIDQSHVKVRDILYFAPGLQRHKAFANPDDRWELDINGRGTLNELVLDEFQFDGFHDTRIDASGTLSGLTGDTEPGGNFSIRNLHTTQTDISLFTGKRLSTAKLKIPETINLNGTINSDNGAMRADLRVHTSSGAARINGHFDNLNDPGRVAYNATIGTSDLQLGNILLQPDLGSVNGDFKIMGQGMRKETMDASITAAIHSATIKNYRYRNMNLGGTIRDGIFSAALDINDHNADANLLVKGNISGNGTFTINGMVDSLKTQPLNLTPGPLIARGKIEGAVSDIAAAKPTADLLISKGLFVAGANRLPLDTILIHSGSTGSVNFLTLRSDVANADLRGQYRLADLGAIIQNSINPYFSTALTAQSIRTGGSYFRFNADIRYSPVFSSMISGLESFDNIHAEGRFESEKGLSATASIPSMVYNGNEFYNLTVNATPADSGLQINARAASIKSGKNMALYNTNVNALAVNNTIRFIASTDDAGGRNKYRLGGMVVSSPGKIYSISLDPDSLLLNYELWSVATGNRIDISPGTIQAQNFVLQKDNQQLRINNADFKTGSLEVQFSQFRLATITGFLKNDSLPADGLINGDIVVTNLLQTPSFTGQLRVNDLSMKKDTIGNLDINIVAGTGNRHNTTATISGRGNDIVMNGYFIPGSNGITTDLAVNVRQLQLATLEGALANVLSGASGSVNGTVRIKGNLSDPLITGSMGFNNASFIPKVLGTRFTIGDQELSLAADGVAFNNFVIRDSAGNSLTLNGRAVTSNFVDYELDIDVQTRNFQVLNTTKAPGKIYYGKLNVTADLRIRGNQLQPGADGRIVVNEGTELSIIIPQAEEGVAQRAGIVEFVDMDAPENDSLFLAYDSLNNSGILGFDVTTTVEIRKEAVFNIVVDEANGDFLNVQGEAQLSAGIDPSGKITLGGNYTLDKGSYQLSFNFLRRKFDIQQGSNIIWTGEPTTARVDIKAVYIAQTAPLDLVSSQLPADVNRNIYLQRLPFEVHLDLTGELLKPVIDFDILLPEKNYGVSNDIVTAVQSRLGMIRQDEGEINKQVFSLLLLNRFVGENPFESGTDAFSFNSYARQSVSRLMTEQLNQLAAGLIDGVDIDFDVISTDDYTTGSRQGRTDLSVGLSKQLLSNRLKISVGSNFQLEGPQNSNQQSNNIAGNVAADYQLSRDGRYRIRFYRQNEYQGIVDGYIIETGVSFIFSVDYERFSQIFRKRKRASASASQNTKPL